MDMDRQKNGRPCTLYPHMNRPRNGGCGACLTYGKGAQRPMQENPSCALGGGSGYGCGTESAYGCRFPSLSMVYNAEQAWEKSYTPEVALQRGTLFASLDLPFCGGKGGNR